MKQPLRHFFALFISVEQLSIYRAVADLCEEFGQTLSDSKKTNVVTEPSESTVAPNDLFDIQRFPTNKQGKQGDLLFNHKKECRIFSNEEQLIKLRTDAGFVKNSCTCTILYDEGR